MQHHGAATTNSTCPYCGVGCGIVACATDNKVQIIGDKQHPANFGRLCVKGTALAETLKPQGRLLQPIVDGKPADWPLAIETAADRLKKIIAEHGPGSVAMYLSGQLLTEDYYVANKLLKGFIGSSHLDTNSRLCMASTVAGHKRAFGEDVVPGCYEDLELADLTVLVGSNLAWAHPVLFQRLLAAKAAAPHKKIVVIDPRRTATADSADLFLPLKPGTDVALFVGLLQYLDRHGYSECASDDSSEDIHQPLSKDIHCTSIEDIHCLYEDQHQDSSEDIHLKQASSILDTHTTCSMDTLSKYETDCQVNSFEAEQQRLMCGSFRQTSGRRSLFDFALKHCEGLGAALEAGRCWQDLGLLADYCELDLSDLQTFFRWFAGTPRTVTVFSQGVNQAENGSDKVNAIINVHLATGRIGKPGACPLSVTGQPNAMGGREVGALANQLAGHLRFPEELIGVDAKPDAEWLALQEFWQAPALVKSGGYTAVDLFAAIGRGEIKAVWVMATNPVVSLPQADLVKQALVRCDLVLVSDIYQDTDTIALADIVFPALGFAEKDGTVTNSERRITRQRAFLPAPGIARADWRIICDVATALGFGHGFDYRNPAQIFREHAALTALCNDGRRALDLAVCSQLSDAEYDAWTPQCWPLQAAKSARTSDAWTGTSRLFADGRFYTQSGKARFIPLSGKERTGHPPKADYFVLNSGRLRDQWHTMTRTGRVPALMQHQSEPCVDIHPTDAWRFKIKDGDLVELTNSLGLFRARARLTDVQRIGELFVPMHWSGQFAPWSRCDVLFDDTRDPISYQPAFKRGQVQLRKLTVTLELVLFSRERDLLAGLAPFCSYAVTLPHEHMQEYRLALLAPVNELPHLVAQIRQQLIDPVVHDQQPSAGMSECIQVEAPFHWRQAYFHGNELQALLYAGPTVSRLDRQWLDNCFNVAPVESVRRQLLRGAPWEGADCSPLVCSCFQVRQQSIQQAIAAGAHSSKSLGAKLQCGTGCGSCLPEIELLIQNMGRLAAV